MYIAAKDFAIAEELFGQVKEPNVSNYVGLMNYYNEMGQWQKTLGLYDQMRGQRKIQPDVSSYLAVLTAVKQTQNREKGKEIEGDLLKQNLWQNHGDVQKLLKEVFDQSK